MADLDRLRMTASPVSRRTLLKFAAAAGSLTLGSSLLAACGDDDEDTEETGGTDSVGAPEEETTAPEEDDTADEPEEPSGEQPDEARFGGTGRIALYSEPPTLDTTWTTAIIVVVPAQHIFEYLFAYDSMFDVKPMLADSFEVSDDALTYTISLREGITFHDGADMTAEDVVASLQRWGELSGDGTSTFERVEEITATDPTTVTITLSSPFAPMVSYLSGPTGGGAIIIPAAMAEAAGVERLEEYVGTGPYKFVEHIPDRHVKMERFEEYAARDEPADGFAGRRTAYFDELEFIPVPDAAARIAGVETGDYHWAEEVTRDEYARLQDHEEIDALLIAPLRSMNVVFNKQIGPMSNVQLRRAALYALQCDAIMAAGFGPQDFWRLDGSMMPPESLWHSDAGTDKYNTGNLDLARQLVEESGYDGELIRWMAPSDREDYFGVALTGTQQLQAIGLNVESVSMDWGSLVERRTQPEEYEIFNTGFSFTPEPTTLSFIPAEWPGWWESEDKEAALAPLMEETDPEARRALWDEFQALVYEEVPIVKTGDFFGLSIKRKALQGENLPVSSFPIFWNQWLEE
ncbi:ABC transporter substrate-binding protein [soil metagenome]